MEERQIEVQMPEETGNEQPVEINQMPELDEIEQVLAEIKDYRGVPIRERYKNLKGKELAKAVAESYANIERFQELELKPENKQYKQQMAERFLVEKARMEQQTQKQEPTFNTEEEKLAYEFAQRYVVPQLMEPISKLQRETEQQLQVNTAIGYAYSKAASDKEFAYAFGREEIGGIIAEYGLPPSNKSIDMAYEIWKGRRDGTSNQQQAQTEQIVAAKNAMADEKSRAQLSTGGARTSGAVSQQDLLDKMREEIMNPNVTPDQAVEIMKKKYKIDVGRPV